jgi:hypothetical protein
MKMVYLSYPEIRGFNCRISGRHVFCFSCAAQYCRSFSIMVILMLLLSVMKVQAETYYSMGSLAVEYTSSWNTAPDGSGTQAPGFSGVNTWIIQSGHAMTMLHNWTPGAGGWATVIINGSLTVSSTYIVDMNGDLTVNGLLANTGTFSADVSPITATGVITINGTYNHARNGGYLPTAVWADTSDCNITGIINTHPRIPAATQPFGNFNWNCPSQTQQISLYNQLTAIDGDFNVISTGAAFTLSLGATAVADLVVGGDFNQTAYRFFLNGGGSTIARTMTVGGSFNLGSGSTFFLTGGSGAGTLNVGGDFSSAGELNFNYTTAAVGTVNVAGNCSITGGLVNMSQSAEVGTLNVAGNLTHTGGTITETSTRNGSIVFKGTSPQVYTSGGTVTNAIYFTVNSGSYLQMADAGTVITGGGIFTLQSGATLGITSPDGITTGAAGNIRVTDVRVFSSSANYIYNSSVAQHTGNALPSTVNSLIINNNGGTVTFDGALMISHDFSITEGSVVSLGTFTHEAGMLIMGGVGQPAGSYGHSSSPATYQNDIYFADATGIVINGCPAGTWLGATNDWFSDINWSAGVPDAATDVTVNSSVVNQPVIDAGTVYAECNNLTIDPGASLNLNAGQALTVYGNLNNSGNLAIHSDEAQSGSLIVYGNSSGNIIYNRQLRPEAELGDYHYFASPVEYNTNSNESKVSVVWEWDEVSGNWSTTSMTSLSSGKGYNLDQAGGSDGLITFTGLPLTSGDPIYIYATSPYGDVIDETVSDYSGRQWADGTGNSGVSRSIDNYGGGGWNLLGNPYTSSLLVENFITANYNLIPEYSQFDPNYVAVYLWYRPERKYYFIGRSTGWGEDLGATHIQAGQGFFVLAMNDNSTFTFTKDMQDHSPSAVILKSGKSRDRWPGLQLKVTYGEKTDKTTVVFNRDMTAGLDPGYDVGLMSGSGAITIYSTLVNDNGTNFMRQALPTSLSSDAIIPIGIDFASGGQVTFSAETEPLRNCKFTLEDRLAGVFTDISSNNYTVTLPAKTYGTGRFFIHISSGRSVKQRQPDNKMPEIRIWLSSDRQLMIQGAVGEKANCTVYNTEGHQIIHTQLRDGELNAISLPADIHGVCLVRVTDGAKVTLRKVAIL